MDWQRELDALVERTMAFTKDVKSKPISDLTPVVRKAEQALTDTLKPVPLPAAPMIWPTSQRDEILQRVSNFRAHQEKMAREREDYYLQAKAKMLAAIDNPAVTTRGETIFRPDEAIVKQRPAIRGLQQ
jgi:hypothetical protein